MKYGSLVIEKKEYVLLKRYMNLMGYYSKDTLHTSVKKLLSEMELALIYDEIDMPEDLIRFNSTVTIASKNGWNRTFKLVMPNDSDIKNDKVSILTPMGAAVMGHAEGDSIKWQLPLGERQLSIKKVETEGKLIEANMIL